MEKTKINTIKKGGRAGFALPPFFIFAWGNPRALFEIF